MNLIQSALALAGRPVPALSADTPSPRRKKLAEATAYATRQEYLAALQELDDRAAAHKLTIVESGDELDRLLVSGQSFAKARDLRDTVEQANYEIDQISRIRPELLNNLSAVATREKYESWPPVRDEAAAFCRTRLLPAVAAYRAALAEWRERYEAVVAEFPNADDILPKMPGLHDPESFAQKVESFSVSFMKPAAPEMPTYFSLKFVIDHAQRTGEIIEGIPPDWRVRVEMALKGFAIIQMRVATLDQDGRPVTAGTEIEMPYEAAEAHVTAGRATYVYSPVGNIGDTWRLKE